MQNYLLMQRAWTDEFRKECCENFLKTGKRSDQNYELRQLPLDSKSSIMNTLLQDNLSSEVDYQVEYMYPKRYREGVLVVFKKLGKYKEQNSIQILKLMEYWEKILIMIQVVCWLVSLHKTGRRMEKLGELLQFISISKIEKNIIRLPKIVVNQGQCIFGIIDQGVFSDKELKVILEFSRMLFKGQNGFDGEEHIQHHKYAYRQFEIFLSEQRRQCAIEQVQQRLEQAKIKKLVTESNDKLILFELTQDKELFVQSFSKQLPYQRKRVTKKVKNMLILQDDHFREVLKEDSPPKKLMSALSYRDSEELFHKLSNKQLQICQISERSCSFEDQGGKKVQILREGDVNRSGFDQEDLYLLDGYSQKQQKKQIEQYLEKLEKCFFLLKQRQIYSGIDRQLTYSMFQLLKLLHKLFKSAFRQESKGINHIVLQLFNSWMKKIQSDQLQIGSCLEDDFAWNKYLFRQYWKESEFAQRYKFNWDYRIDKPINLYIKEKEKMKRRTLKFQMVKLSIPLFLRYFNILVLKKEPENKLKSYFYESFEENANECIFKVSYDDLTQQKKVKNILQMNKGFMNKTGVEASLEENEQKLEIQVALSNIQNTLSIESYIKSRDFRFKEFLFMFQLCLSKVQEMQNEREVDLPINLPFELSSVLEKEENHEPKMGIIYLETFKSLYQRLSKLAKKDELYKVRDWFPCKYIFDVKNELTKIKMNPELTQQDLKQMELSIIKMMRKINELIVVRSFYNNLIQCCPQNSEGCEVYYALVKYLEEILMVNSWIGINKETQMVDVMDRCLEKLKQAINELCRLDGWGPNQSQLEGSSESSGSAGSSSPILSPRESEVNFSQSSGEDTCSNSSGPP